MPSVVEDEQEGQWGYSSKREQYGFVRSEDKALFFCLLSKFFTLLTHYSHLHAM